MLNTRTKSYFIVSILIYIWFIKMETTSADIFAERSITGNNFSATTISLSLRNNVNNLKKYTLFSTNGIVPHGFDISSFRITSDGKVEFNYFIKVISEDGNPLCDKLTIEITNRNLVKISNGKLQDVLIKNTISSKKTEDMIAILSLNESDSAIKQQSCKFKLHVKTYKNSPDEKTVGLFAESELENTVNSGNW